VYVKETFDPELQTLLLSDVVSFTVQIVVKDPVLPLTGVPSFAFDPLRDEPNDFIDPSSNIGEYDSSKHNGLTLVAITIRAWDFRTDQTRQITIIEDL
jgi:hypothetical protein